MQGNRPTDQCNRESNLLIVDDKTNCPIISFVNSDQQSELTENNSESNSAINQDNNQQRLGDNQSVNLIADNQSNMGKRCFDWPSMAVASISPTLSASVITTGSSLIESNQLIDYNETQSTINSNSPSAINHHQHQQQDDQQSTNYSSPYNGLSSYWLYQGAFNSPIKGKHN